MSTVPASAFGIEQAGSRPKLEIAKDILSLFRFLPQDRKSDATKLGKELVSWARETNLMDRVIKDLKETMVGEFAEINKKLTELTANTDSRSLAKAISEALSGNNTFQPVQAIPSIENQEEDDPIGSLMEELQEIPPMQDVSVPSTSGLKRKLTLGTNAEFAKPVKIAVLDTTDGPTPKAGADKLGMAFDIFTADCDGQLAHLRNKLIAPSSLAIHQKVIGNTRAKVPGKDAIMNWALEHSKFALKMQKIKEMCNSMNNGDPLLGAQAAILSVFHRIGNLGPTE